jgi:hypothetical protein
MEYQNGNLKKKHKYEYNSNIKKGKYVRNILKIKVLKNRTDFFINGSYVHSISNTISGSYCNDFNRIGFINHGTNHIKVNYLKVETL